MNFGTALEAMKAGYTVHREGRHTLYEINEDSERFPIREVKPSGSSLLWVPAQSDIMAEDWLILEAEGPDYSILADIEQIITN